MTQTKGNNTSFRRKIIPTLFAASLASYTLADGRITGQLLSDVTDTPLQGSRITLEELNLNTVTGRDGRFQFPDVEPGRYTLSASFLGWATERRQIVVEDEKTVVAHFRISPAATHMEHVLVTGQAGGLNRALNRQRSADNLLSAVSSDAIGQFPDTNVSEALQRLPGLSIERDQGEGRYVRIRGLGPDYNAVTVNGVSLPSPDSGRRAVALDVIPSDLLESLVVSKTITPDMDANSLGGSIEIQGLSAFDRDNLFYSLTAEGSFNRQTEDTSPKLAFTASNQFSVGGGEKNVGIAVGGSWYNRDFGSHNVETGGAWLFDDDRALLEEAEQRQYRINRKRSGLTLNIDYKLNENTDLHWRTLYSEYTDSEIRIANIIEFEEAVAPRTGGAADVERELKDRTETQDVLSTSLGGSSRMGSWTIDYGVALSEAGEREPMHVAGAVFSAEDAFQGASFTPRSDLRLRLPESAFTVTSYALEEVEEAASDTNDQQISLKLDVAKELQVYSHSAQIKFGGKAMERNKNSDTNIWLYEDFDELAFDDAQLSMSEFTGEPLEYTLGRFGSDLQVAPVKRVIGQLTRSDFFDEEESRIEDFDINEDVAAAYIMGSIDVGNLRLLAGARYEDTTLSGEGTRFIDGEFSANHVEHRYDHLLPSVQMRYRLGENTQMRAAWSNTLVRPTFDQLAPTFIQDDDEVEFGNPQLSPLEAANLDLGIEHYMGFAGLMSAYVFYKDIDHFIYRTDLAGSAAFADYSEALTYQNGQNAKVAGAEVAVSRQLHELPAPFNGLLIGANATYVDSEARLEYVDEDTGEFARRDSVLPSQSDVTGNVSIGYESSTLTLRLAANYKSEYLLEVGDVADSRYDVFVAEQTQIDLSAKYYLTESIQLYFEAVNLTDEPYYAYVNDARYNAQYETYGLTYKLGIVLTNF